MVANCPNKTLCCVFVVLWVLVGSIFITRRQSTSSATRRDVVIAKKPALQESFDVHQFRLQTNERVIESAETPRSLRQHSGYQDTVTCDDLFDRRIDQGTIESVCDPRTRCAYEFASDDHLSIQVPEAGRVTSWRVCWRPTYCKLKQQAGTISHDGRPQDMCSIDDTFRVLVEGPSIIGPPVVRIAKESSSFVFYTLVPFDQEGDFTVEVFLQAYRGAWRRQAPRAERTDNNTTQWDGQIPKFQMSAISWRTDVTISNLGGVTREALAESRFRYLTKLPACPRDGYIAPGRWVKTDSPIFLSLGRDAHRFALFPGPEEQLRLWRPPLLNGEKIDAAWLPYSCKLRWTSGNELRHCINSTGSVLVIGTSRERTSFYGLLAMLLKGGLEDIDPEKTHENIPDLHGVGLRWNWWSPWRNSNNAGALLRALEQRNLCTAPRTKSSLGRGLVFITLQEHNQNLFFVRNDSYEYGWKPVVNESNAIFPLGTAGGFGKRCDGTAGPTCLHEFEAVLKSCLLPGAAENNVVWMQGLATQQIFGLGRDWNDANTITRAAYTWEVINSFSAGTTGQTIPYLDFLAVTRAARFASQDGSHYYSGGYTPNSVSMSVSNLMARQVCAAASRFARQNGLPTLK